MVTNRNTFKGPDFEYMKLIAKYLKMNYTMITAKSFDHSVASVGRNDHDLSLCQAVFSHKRSTIAQFMPFIAILEFTINTMKAPEIASYETLFLPFDIMTWSFVLGATGLLITLFIFLDLLFFR